MKHALIPLFFLLFTLGCSIEEHTAHLPKVRVASELPVFMEAQRDYWKSLGLLAADVQQYIPPPIIVEAFLLEAGMDQGGRINGRLSHSDIQWGSERLYVMPIFGESGEYKLSIVFGLSAEEDPIRDASFQVLLLQGQDIEHTGILSLKKGQLHSLFRSVDMKNTTVADCLSSKFEGNLESNPAEEVGGCFANFGVCFWARVADCLISVGEAKNLLI